MWKPRATRRFGSMALFSVLGIAASAQAQQERSLDCLSGTAPPHLSQALQSFPSAERFWQSRQAYLVWMNSPEAAASLQALRTSADDAAVFNQSLGFARTARSGPRPRQEADAAALDREMQKHARTMDAYARYASAWTALLQLGALEKFKTHMNALVDLEDDFRKAKTYAELIPTLDAELARLILPSTSDNNDRLAIAKRLEAAYRQIRWGCQDMTYSFALSAIGFPSPANAGDYPPEFPRATVQEFERVAQQLRERKLDSTVEGLLFLLSGAKLSGRNQFFVEGVYRQLAESETARVLAWLARASEVQLRVVSPYAFDVNLPRAHDFYTEAMQVPAIRQGFEDRRVVLAGLSPSNASPMSLKEKARTNQPPTAADLLALVTGLSMQSTGRTAGVQVSRVAHNQYSYTVPRFNTNGVTTVQIFSPRCQPEGKRQRCSFTYNNTIKENAPLGGSREGGSGADEAEGLLYWTEAGLQSSDIPQLGWYRQSWMGGQPSAGSADDPIERRANERRKTDDYIRERTDREAEEREKRNRR